MTTGLLTTTAGLAAMTADLGGGADLVLTHVAFGDAGGVPYNPNVAQAALVNERYRATIASVAVVDGAIVVDAVIPADTPDAQGRASHGFNVAEAGLFGTSGGVPLMIGVVRMGNGYKPPPSSGQASIATYRLKLACANPSAIAVVIDPQAQIHHGRHVRPFWVTVDDILNAPPANPVAGSTYVVGSTPTGAWAGFNGFLMQWVGVWVAVNPPVDHLVRVQSQGQDATIKMVRKSTATTWVGWSASETERGPTRLATLAEHLAGLGNGLSTHVAGVKAMIDAAITNLIAGAPAALDTLKEISDYITSIFASAAEHIAGTTILKAATPGSLVPVSRKRMWESAPNTGTANDWVITLTPAPTAYEDGMRVSVLLNATNAAGVNTLNVNGLGPKNISYDNGGLYAPQAGDFRSGMLVHLVYRGTFFAVVSVSYVGIATAIQDGRHTYVGATGTGNAIVIAPTPAPLIYRAGAKYRILIAAANTGAVTLAINGIVGTAKPVNYDASTPIAAGDFQPGDLVEVVDVGAAFRCVTITRTALSNLRLKIPYLGFHGDGVSQNFAPGLTRVTSYANKVNNLPSSAEASGIITIQTAGYYHCSANLQSLMPDTSGSYGYALSVSLVDASGVAIESVAATPVLVSSVSAPSAQAGSCAAIKYLNVGDRIAAFLRHNIPGTTVSQKISLDVEYRGT